MVGAVADVLLTKKIYKDQAEGMFVNHVFKEFSSPHGYLRARVCVRCTGEYLYLVYDFYSKKEIRLTAMSSVSYLNLFRRE